MIQAGSELLCLANKKGGKDDQPPTKLEVFLSTLVLYPAFYVLATTPSPMGKRPRRFGRAVAGSARKLVEGDEQLSPTHRVPSEAGGAALAPELHTEFAGFPEARALITLERWCREPTFSSPLTLYGARLHDYLEGLQAWQSSSGGKQTYMQSGVQQLLSLANTVLVYVLPPSPPELNLIDLVILKQQELNKEGEPLLPSSSSRTSAAATASGVSNVGPDAVVQQAQHPAATTTTNPIAEVTRAIAPNVHFIQTTVQAPVSLARGRSWLECLQVVLSWVRVWLCWVAYLFFWSGTLLRLGGNGLSALGGLFAFTVVVSIALSILSALVFLSASGADAIGSCIMYMAKFTDIALEKNAAMRHMTAADMKEHEQISKLGPRKLPPSSFEELDDFLTRQLSISTVRRPRRQMSNFATPIHALRSRPDIPRLAHDPLLVRCYDLQLIDASGNIFGNIGPNEVVEHFDRSGFFAYSTKGTSKVAAIMLLRLLAWRRVVGIVSPPTPSAESEEALRYVFVSGIAGAAAGSVYQFLTGMPVDFKVPCHKTWAEIRSIMHHHAAYAVLACPQSDSEQAADCQGKVVPASASKANWVTDLSHGIVSCLIFTLTTNSLERFGVALNPPSPQPPPPSPPSGALDAYQQHDQGPVKPGSHPLSIGAVPGGDGVAVAVGKGGTQSQQQQPQQRGQPQQELQQQPQQKGQSQQEQQQVKGTVTSELSQVWQALELHRPVLLLVQRGTAAGKDMDNAELEHIREVSRGWTALLTEEANRRGVDPNDLTVAPAAFSDQPPMGLSGFGQISNWVSNALTHARQKR